MMYKKIKGFTLIELLVVIAIISILTPVGYSIMLHPYENYHIESKRSFLQNDADLISRILKRDLRSASKILPGEADIKTSTNSLLLEIPFYNESAEELQQRRVYYTGQEDQFIRKTYSFDASGQWQEIQSHPLSSSLSGIQFSVKKTTPTPLVEWTLFYDSHIAHKDLGFSLQGLISLRKIKS